MSTSSNTTRRRFIAGAGAASAALALHPSGALATDGPRRGGSIRLLHFTDAHVTPGVARSEALTKRDLQLGLAYRPDVVVQGGDAIMDAL